MVTVAYGATPLQSGVSYWQGSIAGSNEGDAGYSFYENVFNLFQEGYPLHTQMGLAAVRKKHKRVYKPNHCMKQTWFMLDRDEGQAAGGCACPKFGIPAQCCNKVQSWCTGVAWSIEGAGGYSRDQFPKNDATWRLGATSACYNSFARTLDWDPNAGRCGLMNVAQLSNRVGNFFSCAPYH